MAKGFSIMDIMSEMSREGAVTETEIIEKVSVFDMQPNEDNFYEISSIEQLKNSIYAMGGVQQNLLLAMLPAGSGYKYKILSGHRRVRACIELVQEGHREFEHVPAVIRKNTDKDTEDMLLVMTNSTQRELTDWEKVMQHMKLKEIIPKLKKRQGIDGRARALEADYLGVSEGQISVYNTIGTKLNAELMDLLKNGRIGISLAHGAAKLEPEIQEQLAEMAHNNGSIYEEDIKQLLGSRPIEGQLEIDVPLLENVTDSVTFGEHPAAGREPVPPTDNEILWLYNYAIKEYDDDRSVLTKRLKEKFGHSHTGSSRPGEGSYQFSPKGVRLNYSDYITSYSELVKRLNGLIPKETQDEPVSAPAAEKKEVCYTNDKDDVDSAIEFIFCMYDFPEDKLHELIDSFSQAENYTVASISAELVFKKMLPYESSDVKVTYQGGYQIEYIHTRKIFNIPIADFWQGFEREFEWNWRKEESEQDDGTESIENVSESDTSEEHPAAVKNTDTDEKQEAEFRGGYELFMINHLIRRYEEYLKIALDEDIQNLICEYNCLLDALYLLKNRITQEDMYDSDDD